MKRTLYFSRFMPTCDAGGGSRRLMQMLELLEDFNCEVISSARADRIDKKALARINASRGRHMLLRPSLLCHPLKAWGASRREAAYRLRAMSRCWSRFVLQEAKPDAVFMDDPVYFSPLVDILAGLQVPIIAVCHNLESLVYNQASQCRAHDLFKEEIAVLSRCRMTIAISREEVLLLNNLGIPAQFFPYFPPTPVLGRLDAVRASRVAGAKEGIILIGNAKNPPTRDGMIEAALYWEQQHLERVAGRLMVAGFDTETMAPYLPAGSGVKLLGSLSNEQLDSILCRVRACLCYQERGAGALTKICEMLIAGVPVIANTVAARSYHGMTGVLEFSVLDGLRSALERLDNAPGGIPAPERPDSTRLLKAIRNTGAGT
jgi:hypothetical protein